MNPAEILDQFVKDWNSELDNLIKSAEMEITPKDEKQIVLILRFISQLNYIKPYMWNSLAYDEDHTKDNN